MQTFSHKQLKLIKLWRAGQLKRINILAGSVRSGKTWISLVVWALWVWSMPADRSYLMVAKTLTSLRRNCLDLLQSLVGSSHFTYSLPAKEARLFGRLVYLEGASDARAESKIRGMTLQGAYVDELTQIAEDFFTMLLSRLSDIGAKLISTTNPDSPAHWVKTRYIDREDEIDLLHVCFHIDDNPFLDPLYVENLKKEYTGVYYSRFVMGEWAQTHGLIYDMFNPDLHVVPSIPLVNGESSPRRYTKWRISCDYGTQNATVFLLWGFCDGVWYCVSEYYYSGRDQRRQKTDEEFADDLQAFIGDTPILPVTIDPSAASFIAALKRRGLPTQPANNAVIDGIRLTASSLQNGTIKICDCCSNLIREFGLYVWDEKSTEDKPVKDNDHCLDSVRYFCMEVFDTSNHWAFIPMSGHSYY